ncbi:hypothetical protein [Streptomyces sp. NPDC001930]|uniref:hypothetical protein n=1 Tax=Streptomyces sp. NPDC001930 TaxID=3364625 RepID=UPI00367C7D0A
MVEVIIAAVAGVLGAAMGSWATMRAARTAGRTAVETARITKEIPAAEIEFVDVSLVDPEDLDDEERVGLASAGDLGAMAILDVKLRNTGGETAYIYGLQMKPWDVRSGSRPSLPGIARGAADEDEHTHVSALRLPPSHYYRGRRNDEYSERHISQVLPPGEVDRFLVSVESPACFFRANITVFFNGGRKAELKDRKLLRKPPVWVDSDSMLELLRTRLEECGPFATWGSQRVSAGEAGKRCLAAYDEGLAAAAAIYALMGRTSDPEYAAIHASRSRIPQLVRDLGLEPQPD